jgi:hypothetical protein
MCAHMLRAFQVGKDFTSDVEDLHITAKAEHALQQAVREESGTDGYGAPRNPPPIRQSRIEVARQIADIPFEYRTLYDTGRPPARCRPPRQVRGVRIHS